MFATTWPVRIVLTGALLFGAVTRAEALVYCPDWLRLSPAHRLGYLVGVFDGLRYGAAIGAHKAFPGRPDKAIIDQQLAFEQGVLQAGLPQVSDLDAFVREVEAACRERPGSSPHTVLWATWASMRTTSASPREGDADYLAGAALIGLELRESWRRAPAAPSPSP